jgi:HK97 gp10 family phage protein
LSIRLSIVGHTGNDEAIRSAENIAANTRHGVEWALWRSGKDIKAEFNRQVLAKDKTGRLYIRRIKGGARRRHIASAPGETPANRTGTYRKGFGFSVDGAHQLTIGNTVKYSEYLEFGTSRMQPRPGLANSIKASERDIIRNLSGGIEDAL